jgi:hypothetical protein
MKKQLTTTTTKYACLLVVSLLFLLVLSASVAAWGVYPARQHAKNTVELQEFQVTMVNSDFKQGHFKVDFGGDLADYAVYNGGLIHFTEDKSQINIPFSLQLKGNLASGRNTLTIVLQEVSNEYDSGVGATIALVAEVIVNIPVEGTVVSAQVNVQQQDTSSPTKIMIGVVNRGDSAVPIWADVVIKGPTNEVITQWTTEQQILAFGATGGIETYWTGTKNPGLYLAEVTLHYGDKVMVLRKDFSIGDNEVIAENLIADGFALGQIVPIDITAYNQWNSMRKGVFGEIFVVTKDGNIVQSFKTSPEDIPAMGRATLKGYWDTSRLVIGEYNLNVLMHYDDKTSQQQFPVVVSIDRLRVMNRVSGQVISEGGSGGDGETNKLYNILIVLIIVLIVVNASWIIMFRKNNTRGNMKK